MDEVKQGSTQVETKTEQAPEQKQEVKQVKKETLRAILNDTVKDNLRQDKSTESKPTDKNNKVAEPSLKPENSNSIPLQPRADFDAEELEWFNSLDDKGKKNMLSKWQKLEGGFNKKFENLAKERKIAESLNEIYKPYERDLQLAGISPIDYTNRLVAADKFSRENPVEFIKWFAQSYSVDLTKLSQSPETEQDPVNKEIQTLREELGKVKQEFSQRETELVAKKIDDFRNSKDENGNLKYPYFKDAIEQMKLIHNSTGEQDLSVLYDKAIRLNDELYSKKLEQDLAKKLAEQQKQADLEKAKKSNTAIKSSPNAKINRQEKIPLRQILRETVK